jgi:hypothetical protein
LSSQLTSTKIRNAFPQPRPLPIHRRQEPSTSVGISSSDQAVQTVHTYTPSPSPSFPTPTSPSSSFTGPVGGESQVSQSTTTETAARPMDAAVSSIPIGGERLVSLNLTTTVAGTAAATFSGAAAPALATANQPWGAL